MTVTLREMDRPVHPGLRAAVRWAGVTAGLAAVVAYVAAPLSGTADDIAYDLIAGGAVAVAVAGGGCRRGAGGRGGWLVAANGCWLVGELIWTALTLVGREPYPSVADVAYLAAYPLAAAGLVAITRARWGGLGEETGLDLAIVAVGAGLGVWAVFLRPYGAAGLGVVETVVTGAYPVLTLLLAVAVLRLVLGGEGRPPPALVLLVAALAADVAADLAFAWVDWRDAYVGGGIIDAGWLVGYVLFAGAVTHPSAARCTDRQPRRVGHLGPARLALLAGALAVAPVTFVALSDDPDAVVVSATAAVLLGALALVRLGAVVGRLARMAEVDPLTGLANRAALWTALEAAVASGPPVAVGYVDIDGFKALNDRRGHAAGDRVLAAVADRLRSVVRPGDVVARVGGDELVVVCPGVPDAAEARRLGERVREAVGGTVGGIGVTASVGVALARTPADAEVVLRSADLAMYRAKRAGGDRVEVALVGTGAEVDLTVVGGSDMAAAAADGSLQVWFQPIVRLADGAPAGVEALVRWHHPTFGLLGGGDVVAVARNARLATRLDLWVLGRVGELLEAWDRIDPATAPAFVSVNVTPESLARPELVAAVSRVVSGWDPGRLWIEVTEDVFEGDPEAAAATIAALRDLGVTVALDDFGTGASSLGRLRSWDIDAVKIDRTFVGGLPTTARDRVIIASVVDLATALGFLTVAEGVETPEQRDVLKAVGCPLAQGWLFGHPWPPPAEVAGAVAPSPLPGTLDGSPADGLP